MSDGSLASFVEDVCGESHLRVEADLGGGFVRLRSSEAERRQAAQDIRSTEDIVIEMLRNARDAHAKHVFVACTREATQRRIVMIDDGDGVPEHMRQLVFEPRVTSKLDTMHMDKWGVHGRGMALYSIAVNASSARIVASKEQGGSAFVIETDLAKLPEKTDQSTFPTFELADSGTVNVRGPKNILRTACEFAIESRLACQVFVGSATDVAATLYAFGLSSVTAEVRAFCKDLSALSICNRLAATTDPASFAACAADLGLIMSERSARRIMDGEIAPLPPLLSRIAIKGVSNASDESTVRTAQKLTASAQGKDERGLKISSPDLEAFTHMVQRAFSTLARDYYLQDNVEPAVRVQKDAIHIAIPIIKQR